MTSVNSPPARSSMSLFRTLKNAGFIACLAGVLVMLSGRYVAGAPAWLVYVGVGVIVLGWGLFACAMLQRAADARAANVETSKVKI